MSSSLEFNALKPPKEHLNKEFFQKFKQKEVVQKVIYLFSEKGWYFSKNLSSHRPPEKLLQQLRQAAPLTIRRYRKLFLHEGHVATHLGIFLDIGNE